MHMSSPWMLGEEDGLFDDLTSHSSGRQSDGCDRATSSGSSGDLSFSKSEFLHKRNPKEKRRMNVAADYDAPSAFYKEDEGGETV
jgi:hypothetical protein